MADVLLISEDYLKNRSVINDNADWQLIQPIIMLVQDLYLRDILGAALYEDLKTKVDADPTLAAFPDYKLLLTKYIQNALHQYILMESLPLFKFRFMNKGVMVKSSENSQSIDSSDLKYMSDRFKNNAEKFAQEITKYLNYNNALFPLYRQNTNNQNQPNRTNYTTGVDLGDEYDSDLYPNNFNRPWL